MSKALTSPEQDLERARYEVEQAKKRFANTKGALQYRLKPSTLASNAWEGVREKGEAAADGALDVAKGHSTAIGGVAAALTLFLAREPIWRALSGLFGRGQEASEDEHNLIKADLDQADSNYDLTAPTVERSKTEGVIA